MIRKTAIKLLALAALAPASTAQTCDPLNILWFGNSLSYGSDFWLDLFARHSGVPTPVIAAEIQGGNRLRDWVSDIPGLQARITNNPVLPAGETWDYVIIQGYATEATSVRGNPAQFEADALTLVQEVHAHSPLATAILVETHAYNSSHNYYPLFYADPQAMASDVSAGINRAAAFVGDVVGHEFVRVSPAGDGFADAGFDSQLYRPDFLHPSEHGRVIIASNAFATMYRKGLNEFSVDASASAPQPTGLERRLLQFSIDQTTYNSFAAIADANAHPYPGSNGDFKIASMILTGPYVTDPIQTITPGGTVTARITSPAQTLVTAPLHLILLHMYDTGNPVPSLGLPELHVPAGGGTIVDLLAPPVPGGTTWSLTVPPTFPVGVSFRIQAAAFVANPCRNSPFTTTDAIEVQIQ